MTPRVATFGLIVALVSRAALAESVRANVGLGYSNYLLKTPLADAELAHLFLQNVMVGFAGSPLARDYLTYHLQGTYSNLSDRRPETKLRAQNLTFLADVALLQHEIVPISLRAQREHQVQNTEQLDTEFLGRSDVTTYGGQVSIQAESVPQVTLAVQQSDRVTTSAFGERMDSAELVASVQAAQSVAHMSYDVLGRSTTSRGSLRGASFTSQYLTVSERSDLSNAIELNGRGALFRREAGRSEPGNPNYLSSDVNLNVVARHAGAYRSTYSYTYAHLGRDTLDGSKLDSQSHSAAARLVYMPDAEWSLAGGAHVQQRALDTDTDEARGFTEAVDLAADLRRSFAPWTASGRLDGLVGHTQPERGASGLAYAVGGQLGATSGSVPRVQLGAHLSANLSEDRSALRTRLHREALDFSASASGIAHSRGRLTVILASQVQEQPLVGRASNQEATLQADGAYGPLVTFQLAARYQSGVSRYALNPLDPLPLPERYNVVTRSLVATAGYAPVPGMSVLVSGQLMRLRASGRRQRADLVEVRCNYQIGRLTLSLWDRLTFESDSGRAAVTNTVFTLVTRSFEASF